MAAQLLIHADAPPCGGGPAARLCRLLFRRGPLPGAAALPQRSTATALQIDDLHGQRFFATDNACALITLPLPAGTYHVTVRAGGLQRRYTVALQDGATVDLHLPPPAAPPRQRS